MAEGVARVMGARPGGEGPAGKALSCTDGSGGADVTLVSVVGADGAGKALVAGCEEAGVKAQATVEMGGSSRDEAGTASYVAMLGGEAVAGVVVRMYVALLLRENWSSPGKNTLFYPCPRAPCFRRPFPVLLRKAMAIWWQRWRI